MRLRLLLTSLLALLLVLPLTAEEAPSPAAALDIAAPQAVIGLGSLLAPREMTDPVDPDAAWFTIAVQNRDSEPAARVFMAADPPSNALSVAPMTGRPALVEAAASDAGVVIERMLAFGTDAFRVVVPPGTVTTLALHVENVEGPPSLLAWTEPALIAHNRQAAILTGLVSGLLAAALAFAAGVAALSSRMFPRWAALFLAGVLAVHLTAVGLFDDGALTAMSGPYALFSFALALALAAAIRLADHVAPFAADAAVWRDRAVIIVVTIGIAAYAGVPLAGLMTRLCALGGAVALAAHLFHCGRLGSVAARHLAPAAAVFALVSAAAALNALGYFGVNLMAAGAIGGFAAAGALLVALSAALPVKPLAPDQTAAPNAALPAGERVEERRGLAAVAASHQGVFDLDLKTGMLSLSPKALALIGLPSSEESLGPDAWLARIHSEDRSVYEQAIATYRQHSGAGFRVEFRLHGPGGREIWCELRATMTGGGKAATRCLGLIADVSARKSLERSETEGLLDPLTGLGNRAALQQRLDRLGAELRRAALAVFDLDRFKAVNESLGRDGADLALAAFVERLDRRFAGERDAGLFSLFRVGGDMFAALLFDTPDLSAFGKSLLSVTAEPFSIAGREVFLFASAGLAAGASAEDGQDLLAQAELALIAAKRDGGGRAALYSAMSASSTETAPRDAVALESDLRHALERGEIELHYQPIVRLSDEKIAGFEALLRWRHPERGLIEPETFVSHAEESGLILPLGRFALKQALADLVQWQKLVSSKPPLFVSVNVAWRQIAEPAFADELAALLAGARIKRRSLKLEVTESAVMKGIDRAETALQNLKKLGVGLSVDDFGTGHSALSHLRRFPFETIKIDRTFVAGAHEKSGAAILRSIVALARDLKLSVVAEGVEMQNEAARLAEFGCEYGQGWFFGAAIPASEVPASIAKPRQSDLPLATEASAPTPADRPE